jgi:hypothetical protein
MPENEDTQPIEPVEDDEDDDLVDDGDGEFNDQPNEVA